MITVLPSRDQQVASSWLAREIIGGAGPSCPNLLQRGIGSGQALPVLPRLMEHRSASSVSDPHAGSKILLEFL